MCLKKSCDQKSLLKISESERIWQSHPLIQGPDTILDFRLCCRILWTGETQQHIDMTPVLSIQPHESLHMVIWNIIRC